MKNIKFEEYVSALLNKLFKQLGQEFLVASANNITIDGDVVSANVYIYRHNMGTYGDISTSVSFYAQIEVYTGNVNITPLTWGDVVDRHSNPEKLAYFAYINGNEVKADIPKNVLSMSFNDVENTAEFIASVMQMRYMAILQNV